MDPSCLLSDEAFARRIAFGLLRDRERAEDLVQQAWLEVLEKGPRAVGSRRGYVASLLRRLSSHKRREESRRRERERASARRETRVDTAALVARAEIHQRTVAAVLALDEPYRSTILLRFFEDRTPAEIAAHDGIPLETARTRLKRALAMLRARLESEGRDWRAEWAVALAGAKGWPEPEPAPLAPLLAWGSAAGVAAVALVAWFVRSERVLTPAAEEHVASASAELGRRDRAPELAPTATPGRVEMEPGAQTVPAAHGSFLSGRVRDETGRPLAGVHVQVVITRFGHGAELSSATSDERGSFSCSLAGWSDLSPAGRSLLGLGVEAWTSGHAPLQQTIEVAPDGTSGMVDLVLVSGRLLTGRVLDRSGVPIGSAFVAVRTSGSERGSRAHVVAKPTDREGWFTRGLEEGERVSEVQVYSAAHGYAHRAEVALPARTTGDVALPPITLQRGHVLRGRCIAPDGAPVSGLHLLALQFEPASAGVRTPEPAGAELAEGLMRLGTTTDELGRFEFAGLGKGSFQVADSSGPLASGAAWQSDGPEIEIVLARHRLRVEVVDPSGCPLEEAPLAVTRLTDTADPMGLPLRTLTAGMPPVAAVTVEPGETVAVLAVVPGCAAIEEQVVVPERPYGTGLRLPLVPEERSATLVLLPSAGPRGDWRVDLCAPFSGVPLPGLQDLPADVEGRVDGLPVGRYRVRIEPRPAEGAGPERCALSASVPVLLSAGETALEFTALSAARLRILFTGASAAPAALTPIRDLEDHAASLERHAWIGPSLMGALGILELEPLEGDSAPLLRRVAELRPRAGQFLDLIVPALPARVRFVLPGREPFECELFPVAGESLEISVPLSETPPAR